MRIGYEMLKRYIWQILLAFAIVIIFFQNSCDGNEEFQKVEIAIPAQKGSFDKILPQKTIKQKDSIVYKKGKTIYTENPINKQLANDFIELQKKNDTLALFKKYVDAIQIKKQITNFENDLISLDIATEVQGTLLSVQPTYNIKEKVFKTEVKKPVQVFALYAGVGISDNKDLTQFTSQAEIGIQLKSGDILSVTADTRQNFGIKYTKQIFKINK